MSPLIRTLSVRALGRFSLAGLALALSACSTTDRFTGPDLASAPAFAKVSTTSKVEIFRTALLRTTPLVAPITRSVLVTSMSGATLSIPELGLEVKIPSGAISGDTLTISVTALAGNAVAYEFKPHGTQFRSSLKFLQDLANTTWNNGKSGKTLGGSYFQSASQINTLTGVASLDELLPVKLNAGKLGMDLWHFSGYMVSMD